MGPEDSSGERLVSGMIRKGTLGSFGTVTFPVPCLQGIGKSRHLQKEQSRSGTARSHACSAAISFLETLLASPRQRQLHCLALNWSSLAESQ